MMTDPIGDMITRLRNGQRIQKQAVYTPVSRMREAVLRVLLEEGYIRGYSLETDANGHPTIRVELKYYENRPVIQRIERRSKPGRRVYSSIKDLPHVANGLGMTILSTPRGVLSDGQARAQGVGGEVLCVVV